jgi:cytidylate kinase
MSLHIAIDGPVAAGKGSVARTVAQRLHALYIDTGAMYRMTALLAVRNGVEITNEEKIVELLKQTKMDMRNPNEQEQDGRLITVFLNEEDVSWQIRTEEISKVAAPVAALKKVREHLVEKQQQIASDKDVVMEGRDITYKVLPNAQLKIYLTADVEVRAQRRYAELEKRGQASSYQEVLTYLKERDTQDMGRAVDPLKVVEDAWVLDTTNFTIAEVVDMIVERASQLQTAVS